MNKNNKKCEMSIFCIYLHKIKQEKQDYKTKIKLLKEQLKCMEHNNKVMKETLNGAYENAKRIISDIEQENQFLKTEIEAEKAMRVKYEQALKEIADFDESNTEYFDKFIDSHYVINIAQEVLK